MGTKTEPSLHLDHSIGEGHILVPPDADWDKVSELLADALKQGYQEVPFEEVEPEELDGGWLKWGLFNPNEGTL